MHNKFNVYDVGRGGSIFANQLAFAQEVADKSNWPDYLYREHAEHNIVFVRFGTNDIGTPGTAGLNAQELYNSMLLYVANMVSKGYEVIVGTVYPRNSWTGDPKNAIRLEYNQMLKG